MNYCAMLLILNKTCYVILIKWIYLFKIDNSYSNRVILTSQVPFFRWNLLENFSSQEKLSEFVQIPNAFLKVESGFATREKVYLVATMILNVNSKEHNQAKIRQPDFRSANLKRFNFICL